MPAKNSTKTYIENGYYHIYNRGVEKRIIFLDQQDYAVFLSYLKEYLLPKNEKELHKRLSDPNISPKEKDRVLKLLRMNNFSEEITLLAYCLMPNHFHFFIKQKNPNSIDRFTQSLCTRYVLYFNKRYKRVGTLFQGVYKAVLVERESQFLYLSKYIHKQALTSQGETLRTQEHPSSYPDYIGSRKTLWVYTDDVLSYFSRENPVLSYANFVTESEDPNLLKNLTLEDI